MPGGRVGYKFNPEETKRRKDFVREIMKYRDEIGEDNVLELFRKHLGTMNVAEIGIYFGCNHQTISFLMERALRKSRYRFFARDYKDARTHQVPSWRWKHGNAE